ncbi:uncharacterized protein LOC116346353 isoform X2 [Contarinia nasturtii]|uniref:uncharacterized protein LOC116346353 isoform X2 n=1 Tax=Contarinia nasturtii TaxID=265458 RepID=UPI0012D3F23E|nr:uncharacterized protein LOC116346353 isoform X2 [Contarinia nasturtii]
MNSVGFSYPATNLSIYAPGHIGICMLSFYDQDKAISDSSTYIVDVDQCFGMNLYNEKLTRLDTIPPAGVVFLVDLGFEGFHRAVCNIQNINTLLLIDIGEIMQVSSAADVKMFSLSSRAQELSARAINCTVLEIFDEYENRISDFTKMLNQQIWFAVYEVGKKNMVVTLHKTRPVETPKTEKASIELTEEERKILFEEPKMMTTNALKAVAGHVPTDEKLICKFYDPKTGGCFKGNSCHLIHVQVLRDGTTRDRKEIKHRMLDQIMPMIGSTYKVCITSIVSSEEFFCHIPEICAQTLSSSLEDFKKQLNAANMVEQYQPYNGVPDLHELILFKNQGVYYRGQVLDHHSEECIVVLFVDYGAVQKVNIRDTFRWHTRWDTIAAYRCILGNIRARRKNDVEAREALRNLILNGSDVSIQVISCAEHLYVRLYDDNGYDVGETLCANGLCINAPRLIPVSTQLPG